MSKITKLATISLIIVMIATFTVGCGDKSKKNPLPTSDNPFALVGLAVRPAGAKTVDKDVDVEGQDAIDLAVELYNLACDNDKEVAIRGIYSVCPTSNVAMNMDNKILLNIYEMKNGEEFYRIDYRLKDDVPLFNMMPYAETPLNNALKLVLTERRYMHTNMDYTRYQSILNAKTDALGIPSADWSDTSKITEYTDSSHGESGHRVFAASQEGTYRKTGHKVETDTITEATVTYDATEGFYKVTVILNLDIDKTTEVTRPYIQEGTGAENAKFDEITIEFEMWDNGYFKEYRCIENWSAKMNVAGLKLDVVSKFDYYDRYTYDEDDCVISKYYKNGEFVDDYNPAE